MKQPRSGATYRIWTSAAENVSLEAHFGAWGGVPFPAAACIAVVERDRSERTRPISERAVSQRIRQPVDSDKEIRSQTNWQKFVRQGSVSDPRTRASRTYRAPVMLSEHWDCRRDPP